MTCSRDMKLLRAAHLFEGSRSYVLSIYIMGSSIVPLPVTITPVESGRYHCENLRTDVRLYNCHTYVDVHGLNSDAVLGSVFQECLPRLTTL
jgi:hypothetical protein